MSKLTFQKLRTANEKRGLEWMGEKNSPKDMLFCATELAGEVGEACNVIKKIDRFNRKVAGGVDKVTSLQNLKDELADVIICTDRLAEAFGIDLGKAVIEKFNKTSIKYKLSTKI